jgi:flagellar basal-body rod protein FlgB
MSKSSNVCRKDEKNVGCEMDITNLPMFGLIKERMSWVGQRQQVIAQNIANADTPNYRARDIKEFDFKKSLREHAPKNANGGGISMRVTHPMHMSGGGGASSSVASSATRKPYETAPDGNSVILEEQMVKMNEAAVQHSTMVGLYRKHLSMIKSVVRGR